MEDYSIPCNQVEIVCFFGMVIKAIGFARLHSVGG
jgi:hypothetical protein